MGPALCELLRTLQAKFAVAHLFVEQAGTILPSHDVRGALPQHQAPAAVFPDHPAGGAVFLTGLMEKAGLPPHKATTLRFYQQAPDELQERAAREPLLGGKTGAEDGV